MRIRFFGRLIDAIGPEIELDAPAGCSVGELKGRLAESHPAVAKSLERSRAFIADSMVADERIPSADETVEFLPPVSGG